MGYEASQYFQAVIFKEVGYTSEFLTEIEAATGLSASRKDRTIGVELRGTQFPPPWGAVTRYLWPDTNP